jgi:predicted DNA-binding transcriptional regulator YafY
MTKDKSQLLRLVFIDRKIREGMQRGRLANCRSMADEYQVSTKSILRDIDYLRNQRDAPLEYDPQRRGYYYTEKNYALPAVTLNESDLFAICIAEKVLQQHRGMPVYRKLQTVFRKITEFLPEKISIQPSWVDTRLSAFPEPQTRMSPEIWETIAGALQSNRQVRILYKKPAAEVPAGREVAPYHVLSYQGEWYLIGLCHERQKVLTFAMSRIHQATVMEKSFTVPADFSMEKFLANRFGIFGGGIPQKVRIQFAQKHVPFVVERAWHPAQEIETLPDGAIILSFAATHLYEIKRWILSWGRGVKVLAPDELVSSVHDEISAVRKEYEQTV